MIQKHSLIPKLLDLRVYLQPCCCPRSKWWNEENIHPQKPCIKHACGCINRTETVQWKGQSTDEGEGERCETPWWDSNVTGEDVTMWLITREAGRRTVVGRASRVAFELARWSRPPTVRGVHKEIKRCARRWSKLQRYSRDVKLDLPQSLQGNKAQHCPVQVDTQNTESIVT